MGTQDPPPGHSHTDPRQVGDQTGGDNQGHSKTGLAGIGEIRIGPDDWPQYVADSEGPQLVVGGPGTGKTEFCINRFCHLVDREEINPAQIAFFSYSRKSAQDITQRIRKKVEVPLGSFQVVTFHAFARGLVELSLLQEDEENPPPAILTAPEQVSLIQRLLENPDTPTIDWHPTLARITSTSGFSEELTDFLTRCQERLISSAKLQEMIDTEPEIYGRWQGIPEFYRLYTEELQRQNRLDYGGLLVRANKILSDYSPPETSQTESSTGFILPYRYLLVDSYQDTSPAQAQILSHLYRPHRNLTVNADPFQAVFSFRGASLENVAEFPRTFLDSSGHPARRFILTKSFRVPEDILKSAELVSREEMPGAAGRVQPADHLGKTDAFCFDQKTSEAEWIANEIGKLHYQDEIPLSEIAVLVRSGSSRQFTPYLITALEQNGIAYQTPHSRLSEHHIVKLFFDLVWATQTSEPPLQTEAVRRILLGPLFALPLGQYQDLLRLRNQNDSSWEKVLSEHLPAARLEGHSGISLFGLISQPQWIVKSPIDAFWHCWGLPQFEDLVCSDKFLADRRAIASLTQVLEAASVRNHQLTMSDWVGQLSQTKNIEANPLLSIEPTDTDFITLTTLHQAKGLEFDVVFIANAAEGIFPDTKRFRSFLNPHLLSGQVDTPLAQLQIREERRLAYTAMTRAKKWVVWTTTSSGPDEFEEGPSRFMTEISGKPESEMDPPSDFRPDPPLTAAGLERKLRVMAANPKIPTAQRRAAISWLAHPKKPELWDWHWFGGAEAAGDPKPVITEPDSFKLSPSKGDLYEKCPRRFAYEHVLGVRAPFGDHAEFGTLCHRILERAETDAKARGEDRCTKADIEVHLEDVFADNGTWNPIEKQAWKNRAGNYFQLLLDRWPEDSAPPLALEKVLNYEAKGMVWRGKADRIENRHHGLTIVDYKTSKSIISKTEAGESLQLGFYYIAAESDPELSAIAKPASAQMWFHPKEEPNKTNDEFIREFDTANRREVIRRIKDITTGVQTEDFPAQVGAHCKYCAVKSTCPLWIEGQEAFVRRNPLHMPVAKKEKPPQSFKINLSPEQQDIINFSADQNLRVEAGAGTGKTTTVALRVATLIKTNSWDPEQVMGITFTNKAVQQLEEKIRNHLNGISEEFDRDIGPVPPVKTYHGFAYDVLREFGSIVGFDSNTTVITPVKELQLIDRVISSTEFSRLDITNFNVRDYIRKFNDVLTNHLQDPRDINKPTTEDPEDVWYQRGDLVRACAEFQKQKVDLKVVSYSDLLLLANRIIDDESWVGETIADRYRAVILDEYQDTNPAQRKLLQNIFCPDGQTRVPLTAIGDEDQTIYEWRGASLQNFRMFPSHFPKPDGSNSKSLTLTTNRRSGQKVLDMANSIRNKRNLLGTKESWETKDSLLDLSNFGDPNFDNNFLKPLRDAPPAQVTVTWEDDALAEARWIADEITSLHKSGIPYKEMAVIFRKNKDMDLIANILLTRGIPAEVTSLGGLLKEPEISDVIAWMSLLSNPDDSGALVQILRGSKFKLGLADLGVLGQWVRDKQRQLWTEEREKQTTVRREEIPLFASLLDPDQLTGLTIGSRDKIRRFLRLHEQLLVETQGKSVGKIARLIISAIGGWRDLVALEIPPNGSLRDVQGEIAELNLHKFLDLADDWEPLYDQPTLDIFLRYLEDLKEDKTEETKAVRIAGTDTVTLITVHRAKGLEWEAVFIPALYINRGRGNFPSTGLGFDNPIKKATLVPYELRLDREVLPDLEEYTSVSDVSAVDKLNDSKLRKHNLEQELRLAYVATTRAKSHLYLSGAWWYGSPESFKKECKPSELWFLGRQIGGSKTLKPYIEPDEYFEPPPRPELIHIDPPKLDQSDEGGWVAELREEATQPGAMEAKAVAEGQAEEFDRAKAELEKLFELPEPAISEEPEPLKLSVTDLSTYSVCPKRFFWSVVDPLPRRFSLRARRGTDIHRQIELHNRGVVPLEEAEEVEYDTNPDDNTQTGETKSGGAPKPPPFQVFKESEYYQQKPILVEELFELKIADWVWIRGRIDAVYSPTPKHWEIVDFKTGAKPGQPNMVQLQAYALAAEKVRFTDHKPDSTEVSYVYLGNGLEREKVQVNQDWLIQAQTDLDQIISGIRSKHFEPTPNPGCAQCDFLNFCEPGQQSLSAAT